jgi:hypothetical protein
MASESPTWRLPSNSMIHKNMPRDKRHDEELISAYEAEEERITNVLCRKLEQVRFYNLFFTFTSIQLTVAERRENCTGEQSRGGIGIARQSTDSTNCLSSIPTFCFYLYQRTTCPTRTTATSSASHVDRSYETRKCSVEESCCGSRTGLSACVEGE